MIEYAWLIPLFPLLSFIILLLFGKKLKEKSSFVGIGLTFITLLFSVIVLGQRFVEATVMGEWEWLKVGETVISFGFEVNALNALMLFIVSLVSFLVHMYSRGYMHGDKRIPVFYAYLGLFTFAMLGLVISTNLLQLYIFWELVGLGSFLLIGFYFYKEEAKKAAKKAFIMTRIGDVGLFIGMILLFIEVGSFRYSDIFAAVESGMLSDGKITLCAILIFIGAMGKSGQFPLHTWLPDAMEGPTPVSALIHAATMVAAGVYLVATMFPLFEASVTAMMIVAVVGGFTAIFAATIGLTQNDIKRVLAYSTVSQLGYMMLALGSAGYVAGVFHLTTHAFFKALLFLAAGSVIHAVHTQDIEKMGGLFSKMKTTATLFLIGTMAISGVPLLSGFFSKDEILVATWNSGNYVLFFVALIAAFFTAFYMFRLFFMVFAGEKTYKQEVHESPSTMVIPMMVLGFFAIFAGYINTPWFGTFLGDWLAKDVTGVHGHESGPIWIMIAATVVSLVGIALAYFMYGAKKIPRDTFVAPFSGLYTAMKNKYYVDEVYEFTFVKGTKGIGVLLYAIDRYIVDGIVACIKGIVLGIHSINERLQNGQVQTYGTVTFIGLVIILVVLVLAGGYIS
ncbi:MAG: NADH-quinone oxidoreductase subunit L [Bacillaceae bacterium]